VSSYRGDFSNCQVVLIYLGTLSLSKGPTASTSSARLIILWPPLLWCAHYCGAPTTVVRPLLWSAHEARAAFSHYPIYADPAHPVVGLDDSGWLALVTGA
jgi:hypothetical protein